MRTTQPYGAPRFWHVTASQYGPKYDYHWNEFYDEPQGNREGGEWCGRDGIDHGPSIKRIREQMSLNDIVVSYQAREGILGLARVEKKYRCTRKGKEIWTFDLRTSPAVGFKNPLTCAEMRRLPGGEEIEFVRCLRGTVFEIKPFEFKRILSALLRKNPKERGYVDLFLNAPRPASLWRRPNRKGKPQ